MVATSARASSEIDGAVGIGTVTRRSSLPSGAETTIKLPPLCRPLASSQVCDSRPPQTAQLPEIERPRSHPLSARQPTSVDDLRVIALRAAGLYARRALEALGRQGSHAMTFLVGNAKEWPYDSRRAQTANETVRKPRFSGASTGSDIPTPPARSFFDGVFRLWAGSASTRQASRRGIRGVHHRRSSSAQSRTRRRENRARRCADMVTGEVGWPPFARHDAQCHPRCQAPGGDTSVS